MTWTNWSRTVTAEPAAVEAPADEAALAALLARTRGPVRAMGSGHSWSPLGAVDPGTTQVVLGDAFAGLRGELVGDEVWVGAATRLSALHGLLARRGRSLPNVGSISHQTLAGIVATGTHGAGSRFPCLSAAVTGVRTVTASGERLEVTDPGEVGYHALSLGLLGVQTALRIRTAPLFYVEETQLRLPIGEAPDRLPELVAAEAETPGLRHRFAWFPYGRIARIQAFRPVPPPEVLPDPFEAWPLASRVEARLVTEGLFEHGLLRLTRLSPGLAPAVCRFAEAVHFRPRPPRVGRLFERINEPGVPRHRETEWAVPLARAPEAWRALRAAIESRRLPADFLQELRPAAADGLPLSAARDGAVCWVSLYQTTPHRWDEALAVAADVLGGLGGRPHWGKEHPPLALAERGFEAVRRRLDPAGRFLGPWHRRLGFGE